MERRISARWCPVPLFKWALLLMVLASGSGCAKNLPVEGAPGPTGPTSGQYLASARALAHRGESHRAEEYFLAALDAGGSSDEIYPELIEVCIEGGRLGSAVLHVEKRLRARPDDVDLLRLSISLQEALGNLERAAELAARFVEVSPLDPEQHLFIAGYFDRVGDPKQALDHYRSYWDVAEEEERPAWVMQAVLRLERRATLSSSPEDEILLGGDRHE